MNALSMILRIVAITCGIAAAVFFFISQSKLDEKQTALDESRATTAATQAELGEANSEITSLESKLEDEKETLAQTERTLDSVRAEVFAAKQEITGLKQNLSKEAAKVAELETSSSSLRQQLVSVERELAAVNNDVEVAKLEERVSDLEDANADLQSELASAQAIIETRKAISEEIAAGPVDFGREITIASLSAENGLIAFKSEPDLNLTRGSEFKLIDKLNPIGAVQVTKVTPDYTIGNLLPGANTRVIVVGSTVKMIQ